MVFENVVNTKACVSVVTYLRKFKDTTFCCKVAQLFAHFVDVMLVFLKEDLIVNLSYTRHVHWIGVEERISDQVVKENGRPKSVINHTDRQEWHDGVK